MVTSFIVQLLVILVSVKLGTNALSINYYGMSCIMADLIVKNTVIQGLQKDPTLAAGLLRMHFHDCFLQGCDGSVLIDSTNDNTAEKDSPANLSLRGYELIDQAKQNVEDQCPGTVSCADILAMAARDAVFWSGGPYYEIPKGRKDGRRSRIEDTINLPAPIFNSTQLIKIFGQHGFNVQEVVALSGAHTLGVARCSSFKNRLSKFDTTHDVDPTLDSNFAKTLSSTCSAGDTTEVAFDRSRNSFDNGYFNALQRGLGVLSSDQTLFVSPQTRGLVNAYAMNTARFFLDFQTAIIKMGLLDVKEGDQGENGSAAIAISQNMRNIEPLNGSNFSTWKLNAEIMLAIMNLDYVLTQDRPELAENMTVSQIRVLDAETLKWDRDDRLCKKIIQSTICESLRGGLPDANTAKDLWAALKEQFVGSQMSRQFTYLQKLMKLSYDGTGSVREHLLHLSRLVLGIRESGMEFSDRLMVRIGVISLPDVYDTFKVTFSAQKKHWEMNQLISLCVAEEDRLKSGKKDSVNLSEKRPYQKNLKPKPTPFKPKWRCQKNTQMKGRSEPQLEKGQSSKSQSTYNCYHCGKVGHMMAECRSKLAGRPKTKEGVEAEKKAKAKRAVVPRK